MIEDLRLQVIKLQTQLDLKPVMPTQDEANQTDPVVDLNDDIMQFDSPEKPLLDVLPSNEWLRFTQIDVGQRLIFLPYVPGTYAAMLLGENESEDPNSDM